MTYLPSNHNTALDYAPFDKYTQTAHAFPRQSLVALLALKMIAVKSNRSLYSLHYAEACSELAGPIFVSLRPGNTPFFEELSLRLRAVGNTVPI